METNREREIVKQGFKLLAIKLILGAAAAGIAMGLMRVAGGGEILVALLIGLVPGVAERSSKKMAVGAVLAVVGYLVGARVGIAVARSASGVPLGHWAVTGAFIGMTSGMSSLEGRWFSSRYRVSLLGAAFGFFFGGLFGVLGDIAGFLTVAVYKVSLFYYLREVSLLCAGIFINLGAGVGAILEAKFEKKLGRKDEPVETAEA